MSSNTTEPEGGSVQVHVIIDVVIIQIVHWTSYIVYVYLQAR